MKGIEVKEILQKNGYTLKDVANLMGETPQNFQALLKVEDIKTGVLERIAKAINKNILFFYNNMDGVNSLLEKELNEIILRKLHCIEFYPASILYHLRHINEAIGGEKFDKKQFKIEEGYASQFSTPFKEPFYIKYSIQEKLDFIKELDEAIRSYFDNIFVLARDINMNTYTLKKDRE
jgi:transcriptional regulator with XRE-family HTH domain